MAENIDLNALVEEAKRKRKEALAAAKSKETQDKIAQAKKLKSKNLKDEANRIVLAANNKFDYANSLEPVIKDYEFTINFMAKKIARGDTLRADEQDRLDFALKNYPKLTDAYTKAMNEGNKILVKMPKGVESKITVKTRQEAPAGTEISENGTVEGTKNTGPTVEQQNKKIDALVANARERIAKMGDADRKMLAQALTDAGFETPAIGKFNEALVINYKAALSQAKSENTNNAELIKSGVMPARDFTGFLSNQTALRNELKGISGTGTGGSNETTISQRISDPTQAASEINSVFTSLLKRDATDQEMTALTKILNDFEKKNPFVTKDGKTTGGLDRAQFLTDVIKKGTYAGNAKAFPKILKSLASEVSTRKAGAEEKAALGDTQAIQETARLNGVNITQEQLADYLSQIKAGKDIGAIQQGIRNIAATGYPENIKKLIAEGNDLSTIYSPYRNAMASELELNSNTIGLEDPVLQSAIGPDKEMTLFDFKKSLRKDPRWQYTENARSEASSLVSKVLKDFGFQG